MALLTKLENNIVKFIWDQERSRIAKVILCSKDRGRGITSWTSSFTAELQFLKNGRGSLTQSH